MARRREEDEVAATRAELAEKRILLDAESEELQRDRLLLRSGNMFDSEPSSTLEAKLTKLDFLEWRYSLWLKSLVFLLLE